MVVIKKANESFIIKKHPWIFKNTIAQVNGNHKNGDIIKVCSEENNILCYGFYSPESYITVRIISFGSEEPETEWIKTRINNAYNLRKELRIPSNGYRLINAEGDFIPGLIIDVYNKTTVVRPLIKGIENNLSVIVRVLDDLLPGNSIYIKRDEYSVRKENITLKNKFIKNTGNGDEVIKENGLSFTVDILTGQKTGFYLDLRDARILASQWCRGKSVLNLFAYTGAFAFHAARGGADKVLSVEQSKKAIEYAHKNVDNNPHLKAGLEWIQDDVFDFITHTEMYDVIILDPPPFARKKQEVKGALKGYYFLNKKAFENLSKSGLLFTFSCSSAVTKEMFLQSLSRAALHTGKDIRIIRELHSSPDHPYSLVHPEGEYLKGWVVYVT